jgi:predicted transcriptional regulator
MVEAKKTLTTKEMGQLLGIHESTVRYYIKTLRKEFEEAGAIKEVSLSGKRKKFRIVPERFVEVLKKKGLYY